MKVLGNISYTKLHEIGSGEGRNSKVFQIRDEQLGADLVAKEVDKAAFRDPLTYFEEAKAVYAVQHEHVLKVQYAGQSADQVFVIMPRAKGGSLQGRLVNKSLLLSKTTQVMQQLLTAVAHVHSRGFLHLDIKPSNILFDEHDRVLLADFGQSAPLDSKGVVTQLPGLYPRIVPPEVISNAAAVQASDIYQCAFTLLRCLWGDWFLPPLPRSSVAVMALEAEIGAGRFPPRKVPVHVPARLQRAVMRGLAVDPGQRYQTATEFKEELGRVDVKLDWQVTYYADRVEWLAARPEHTNLRVVMRGTKFGKHFAAEIYSESAATKRKHKRELWGDRLTSQQCEDRLKKIFRALP